MKTICISNKKLYVTLISYHHTIFLHFESQNINNQSDVLLDILYIHN